MLEGDKLDLLNEFLDGVSGKKTFMLYYQLIQANPVNRNRSEMSSIRPATNATTGGVSFNLNNESPTAAKIRNRKHLVVTNGLDQTMAGLIIVLSKDIADFKLDWKNVAENLSTSCFHSKGQGGAPEAIQTVLSDLLLPSIQNSHLKNWQPYVPKSINGRVNRLLDPDADVKADKLKQLTIQKLNKFLVNLQSARYTSENKLTYFTFNPDIDWKHMPPSPDKLALPTWIENIGRRVSNNDSKYLQIGLKVLENQMMHWAKTIQDVLNEASRMRKENTSTTGPAVELQEWKERYAGFAHLIEQIRSDHRIVITRAALLFNGSKITEAFNEVDALLTDANNQAMDNVRFLYSLETYWQPLYGTDIDDIGLGRFFFEKKRTASHLVWSLENKNKRN